MAYDVSVSGGIKRESNPITLLIHIGTIPMAHIIREGISRSIFPLIRVVKMMPVLLLPGNQMVHVSFTTIGVDPKYLRGDQVKHQIIPVIL